MENSLSLKITDQKISGNLDFSLIIPTYNEAKNIKIILQQLEIVLKNISYEIIIIDDNSPDNTFGVAQEYCREKKNIRAICRNEKRGLSTAVIKGFSVSRGDLLGVIDADLSHDCQVLPKLIEAVKNGADIAVGSRRIKGGSVDNWPWYRKLSSDIATFISKFVLNVFIEDPMSGFFVINKKLFYESVSKLYPRGYKILLEFIIKSGTNKVVEYPYVFKDRKQGYSKMTVSVIINYFIQICSLLFFRLKNKKH